MVSDHESGLRTGDFRRFLLVIEGGIVTTIVSFEGTYRLSVPCRVVTRIGGNVGPWFSLGKRGRYGFLGNHAEIEVSQKT
jgi:hypothetical protein